MSDAVLHDLAARAAAGDGAARARLAAEARRQAREILAEGRFQEGHHGSGPLHALLQQIGEWVHSLDRAIPGGTIPGWLLVALLVALVTAAAGSFVLPRRGAPGPAAAPPGPSPAPAPGAGELERRAAQAERDGDLDTAVRLLFQAGLLRLHEARAIELRPSLTSGEVARRLRSPRFDALAGTHDAVAYGGRTAVVDDAARAREDWPVVVGEAREG